MMVEGATDLPTEAFTEKGFYLREFRGRTLGIYLPSFPWRGASQRRVERRLVEESPPRGGLSPETPEAPREIGEVAALLAELRANRTRVVLFSEVPLALPPDSRFDAAESEIEGRIWRALRASGGPAQVVLGARGFPAVLEIAKRLALFKVVRLSEFEGVVDGHGQRRPFVDRSELDSLQTTADPALGAVLREVGELLDAGVPNVNLCTAGGLPDELFSYSGSGTLFTRERYVVVRRLGIDDYDAAFDLMARGVAEGFLAPRSVSATDRILAVAFGAFVEGAHLAGIGALALFPEDKAAEVASLYTVTRFTGQGLGAHLVSYALKRAAEENLFYVFACTTSSHVGALFVRHGFRPVAPDELPAEKWQGYDEERRERVLCFRRDLAELGR